MHVLKQRSNSTAYDTLMRYVWRHGNVKIDQRGDEIIECKHVFIEIDNPENEFPDFGTTTERYGEDFAKKLFSSLCKHEYTYGERINRENALENAVKILKANPETRRVVLPVYLIEDVQKSLDEKEVPCVTGAYIDIEDEKVDLSLMMRSNDIVTAFPSDLYGFREIQAYVAKKLRREVGVFRYYSRSCHIIMNNDGQWLENYIENNKHLY